MDVFDSAWDQLAEESKCDARGGAEYQRLRAFWDRVWGKIVAIEYILKEANKMPDAEDFIE